MVKLNNQAMIIKFMHFYRNMNFKFDIDVQCLLHICNSFFLSRELSKGPKPSVKNMNFKFDIDVQCLLHICNSFFLSRELSKGPIPSVKKLR